MGRDTESGFGMIGLLLSVGLLVLFIVLAMQSVMGDVDPEKESTYEQGVTAIDDAEKVKKQIESRYAP